MRIGILLAGHVREALQPKLGDFDSMFAELLDGHGFEFVSYDVEGMMFPASPEECDGWLISGSKHGVYEDHPFIPPLETFIRECVDADRPVVGICFGHQIVAQALGGKVVQWDGGWGLGRQSYDSAGKTLNLNVWHQDQVTELAPGARNLGGNPFCENGIISYGRRAWTIQAHPEFGNALISAYSDLLRGTETYPSDRMDAAAAHAAENKETDAGAIAIAIANFFQTRDDNPDLWTEA